MANFELLSVSLGLGFWCSVGRLWLSPFWEPLGPRGEAGLGWGRPPRCNPCFLPSFGGSPQLRGCG
jgi:hypothetical protein